MAYASPGPKVRPLLERIILGLFKWIALAVCLVSGTGALVSLVMLALTTLSGQSTLSASLTDPTLAEYLENARDAEGAARSGGEEPVFTYMPAPSRRTAYQAVFNTVLETGREADLIGDIEPLTETVNGALVEFDTVDHPEDGTFALVFMTRLADITRDLKDGKGIEDGEEAPKLETVALWLRTEIRKQMAQVSRAEKLADGGILSWGYGMLALMLGLVFLVSGAVWGLLSYLALDRTHWIVLDDAPHAQQPPY